MPNLWKISLLLRFGRFPYSYLCLKMKHLSRSILPMTAKKNRQNLEYKLAIPLSFFAGILVGIPITYCLMLWPLLAQDETLPSYTVGNDFASNPHRGLIRNGHPIRAGPVGMSSPRARSEAAADLLLRHPAVTEPSELQHLPREKSGLAEAPNAGELAHTRPIPLVKPISNPSARESHNGERFMKNPHIGKFSSSSSHSLENASSFALEDVANGIFWSSFAEELVPKGFDEEDINEWKRFLNTTEVLKIEEGCGRMQNRLVTLAEGGKSCCRYRYNNDQIQGEIFSFYLGKVLGIKNLAPSSLALVDPRTTRWSTAASQIALAQWNSEKPVVLTQFVEKLQPAFIPRHFRDKKKRRLHPLAEDIKNLTLSELSELVQWTDLVIFDYLTANLDRAVNNMYNERWNADMMNQPTHNLAKTPEGLLLFLDNESGLLHGYRLLEKYEHFHRAMLDGLCIFKKDTIDAVEKLHRDNNLETVLKSAFVARDPGMSDWLPFLPDRSIRTLKERIANVIKQVRTCKSRFETKSIQTPITDR